MISSFNALLPCGITHTQIKLVFGFGRELSSKQTVDDLVSNAMKRLPAQFSACVVDVLCSHHSEAERASLSVVGSSSEISSSQEAIICETTAACRCPVFADKQQPEYNHLSHIGLLRS